MIWNYVIDNKILNDLKRDEYRPKLLSQIALKY